MVAAPVSLAEVMSEELADQLHKKELKVLEKDTAEAGAVAAGGWHEAAAVAVADIPPDTDAAFDTSDDLVIAQMLQKQFDREHDMALAKEERSLNRSADSVFGFEYHTLEN